MTDPIPGDDVNGLIERLTMKAAFEADQAKRWQASSEAAEARVKALEEVLGTVTSALKPFAAIGCPSRPDHETVSQVIEIGTIRDARDAIRQAALLLKGEG